MIRKGQEPGKTGRSKEQKVRTRRLFVIDEAIRSGKYPNTDNLATLAKVNFRTIQRDIEYMRDMFNASIEYCFIHRGYYYSESNYYLKSVPITEGESFSIVLFNQLLEQYRNTPFEKKLRQVFRKIVDSLSENVSIDTSFLSGKMSFISDRAEMVDAHVFKTIFSALKIRQMVNFEYRPLQKTITVDPYHSVCQRGDWHIIGKCHDKNQPRMFSLARIKNAALTKKGFAVPDDFKVEKYFDKDIRVWVSSHTPYTVELLIENEIEIFAPERQWPNMQKVEQRVEGVYVKFTTTQMPEVVRWVLG